jgi:hypothetical protein
MLKEIYDLVLSAWLGQLSVLVPKFDAGAQIAATVHPTSSADQLLPSALKRTSNVYCFVRTPCTAVPGAVFMALISFPWPMMTMFQVPSE